MTNTLAARHKHIPLVDLFKGFAILMVVIVHTEQIVPLPQSVDFIAKFGQMGCQIFFIMSSFSMRYNESSGGGGRIIRKILPAYWSIVLFNLILTVLSTKIFKVNVFRTSDSILDYIVNLFFMHGIIPTEANNYVVLGGWFIGTLVILYILYPYISRIYQHLNIKYRFYLFPIIVFIFSSLLTITIDLTCNNLIFSNNSFLYFSFINQLPVFCLGFPLYDVYTGNVQIKYPLVKGIALLIASIILFNTSIEYIFITIPFIFGLSVVCVFAFLMTTICNLECWINKILVKFSKLSLQIYLTHSFVIYYLLAGLMKVISYFDIFQYNITKLAIFTFLLPCVLYMTYKVGELFSIYQKYLDSKFNKLLKVMSNN